MKARALLVAQAGTLTDEATTAIARYLTSREREVARLKRGASAPWRALASPTYRRALGRAIAALAASPTGLRGDDSRVRRRGVVAPPLLPRGYARQPSASTGSRRRQSARVLDGEDRPLADACVGHAQLVEPVALQQRLEDHGAGRQDPRTDKVDGVSVRGDRQGSARRERGQRLGESGPGQRGSSAASGRTRSRFVAVPPTAISHAGRDRRRVGTSPHERPPERRDLVLRRGSWSTSRAVSRAEPRSMPARMRRAPRRDERDLAAAAADVDDAELGGTRRPAVTPISVRNASSS